MESMIRPLADETNSTMPNFSSSVDWSNGGGLDQLNDNPNENSSMGNGQDNPGYVIGGDTPEQTTTNGHVWKDSVKVYLPNGINRDNPPHILY